MTNRSICIANNISLSALDLEMKIFHKYTPAKWNHKLPSLVFVVANKHMFPIVNDALQKSLFAAERVKESSFCYWHDCKKRKTLTYDGKQETIVNKAFEQICGHSNVKLTYTNMETLLPLVIHLFKEKNTILQNKQVWWKHFTNPV